MSPDHISEEWVRILKQSGLALKLTQFHVLHFDTLGRYFEAKCKAAGTDPTLTAALLGKPKGLKKLYLLTGITDFTQSLPKDFLWKEYVKVVPMLRISG